MGTIKRPKDAYKIYKNVFLRLYVLREKYRWHHWNASGQNFYGDHELFGEFYREIDSHVDEVAEFALAHDSQERIQSCLTPSNIMQNVTEELGSSFPDALALEKQLCNNIEGVAKNIDHEGVSDLLGRVSSSSKIRQYKLERRLKS